MKNRFQWFLAMLCIGIAAVSEMPSMADTTLPLSEEVIGVNKVLDIISNVNLRQTDANSAQSILDIMDLKNQMYSSSQAKDVAAGNRWDKTTQVVVAKGHRKPVSEPKAY